MADIRAFFALEVKDAQTISNIKKLQEKLALVVSPIKMVELENVHLTVRFLGNITELLAEKLFKFIEENINLEFFKEGPLSYDVCGLSDFSKRVFFVKLRGDIAKLTQINNIIENELVNNHKFPREENFKTHITIGRLKESRGYQNRSKKDIIDTQEYQKLKAEYTEKVLGTIKFDRLYLKKSTLTQKGPIYENLKF